MNDLPNYDTWKTAYPPEWDDPEPSEEHFQGAFEELCTDAELLCEFLDSCLLLGAYREWLGGRLADKAEAIMKAAIERDKFAANLGALTHVFTLFKRGEVDVVRLTGNHVLLVKEFRNPEGVHNIAALNVESN